MMQRAALPLLLALAALPVRGAEEVPITLIVSVTEAGPAGKPLPGPLSVTAYGRAVTAEVTEDGALIPVRACDAGVRFSRPATFRHKALDATCTGNPLRLTVEPLLLSPTMTGILDGTSPAWDRAAKALPAATEAFRRAIDAGDAAEAARIGNDITAALYAMNRATQARDWRETTMFLGAFVLARETTLVPGDYMALLAPSPDQTTLLPTREARTILRAFQRENRIPNTGAWDRPTFLTLVKHAGHSRAGQ